MRESVLCRPSPNLGSSLSPAVWAASCWCKEVTFPSEDDAKRAGQIFAGVLGGAVAFRRMNDPDTGAVGRGVIIEKYGVMAEKSASQAVDFARE